MHLWMRPAMKNLLLVCCLSAPLQVGASACIATAKDGTTVTIGTDDESSASSYLTCRAACDNHFNNNLQGEVTQSCKLSGISLEDSQARKAYERVSSETCIVSFPSRIQGLPDNLIYSLEPNENQCRNKSHNLVDCLLGRCSIEFGRAL